MMGFIIEVLEEGVLVRTTSRRTLRVRTGKFCCLIRKPKTQNITAVRGCISRELEPKANGGTMPSQKLTDRE